MAYTTIDDPSAYFQTTLYTGDGGGTRAVTHGGNSDLNADWVWIKDRGTTSTHYIFDSVRDVQKHLTSAASTQELSDANSLKAFNSNSFTLGTSGNVNGNSRTFVSWNWKAGGSASNNTDGDITSSVSVNQEAGFSIIKYDSNNTAGQTVGHGLGVTPNFLIFKKIDGATNWHCWSDALATTNYINLNLTDAQSSSSDWLGVSSSLITLKTNWGVTNDGGNFICYAFANKQGYSKFGSYTGNGNADGTFVYTGFKPAFVICKRSDATEGWMMIDNKRANPFNPVQGFLRPNGTNTENDSLPCDFNANGFKWRSTDGLNNTSGGNYIYMCFAENPFVTSSGVPTTAK